MRYQNTDIGWTSLGIIGAAFVVNGVFWRNIPLWINVAAAVALFFCAFFLASLTIRVSDDAVEWWFTAGLARQKLAIAEIRHVSARTIIPLGWGIRTNGRDVRYIVTGRKVLAIERKDGRCIEIGASEADKIEKIIAAMLK